MSATEFYLIKAAGGSASNGTADATLLDAQGAGKVIRVVAGFVTVHVAAAGTGGKVALEDGVGGTRFFEADANAVGHYVINFGQDGFPLNENTLFNLTVDGAVTTQATARASFVVKVNP